MARKGRARRFREARELKQGFDDGLFSEGDRTLADISDEDADAWDDDDLDDEEEQWDEEDPLLMDEGGRAAAS